jgi:hypothetical protein
MAIALVASEIALSATGNSVTTGAIDTTGADLLILQLESFLSATEPTVSDSKGNTWTPLTAYGTGVNTRTRIFYSVNPTVGSGHTFTATGLSTFPSIVASAWSGADTATPFDQENGATIAASSTSAQTGSVTPSEDGELIIAAWGHDSATTGTPSVNGGFTLLEAAPNNGQAFGIAQAYLIQTSAAAANPTLSWTGGTAGSTAIATFKAAAGGGGGGNRRRRLLICGRA